MRFRTMVCATLVFLMAVVGSRGQSRPVNSSFPSDGGFGRLPLTFEMNQGQADSQVKFISRGPGYRAYLTSEGMLLALRAGANTSRGNTSSAAARKTAIRLQLVGAAKNPKVVGENLQPGRVSYFLGNNPAKWHLNVPTYGQVRYKNVYPGIDLVYYGNQQQLEYDFSVAPHADPNQIEFEITGAAATRIAADGSLALRTATGDVSFQAPVVYQLVKGRRVQVSGRYAVTDSNHIRFDVKAYDAQTSLVIDPVLLYSTYLGGSGDEQPAGIAVDSNGYVYVAGSTDSSDFPMGTIGALPTQSDHVYVAKIDPTGSHLIYADYLGGSSEDFGFALALDSSKNVYVTGSTASSDFPMVRPYMGTYPGSFNAFLSKISADGASLLYSTYFGGNSSDIPAGVAVDMSGNMLIAGYTSSTNLVTSNAFQGVASANQGGMYGQYGFLTKFTADGSSLVYSTYFGGSSNVALSCGTPCWPQPTSVIASLATDAGGNAYVAGTTNTYDFPVTQGAYLTTNTAPMNSSIGFVGKFSSSGSLQYSTYFYGSSGFQTNLTGIAADAAGSAYVTGAAFSDGTFPITTTSICDPSVDGWACSYAFVTKFDSTGAALLYSTFLGANNLAIPRAIALDSSNDAYVLAFTSSNTFNPVNGVEPYNNGNDLLLAEVDASGTSQVFATFLGGSGDDEPAPGGLAVDSNGNIYVAGATNSVDLPVTPSAFEGGSAGNTDSFIMKIGPQSAPAVILRPTSLQFALTQVGTTSSSQRVTLQNLGSASLTISSMNPAGDFSETDNCNGSVEAASSCTIAIQFSPTNAGVRVGAVSIQDDAAGAPHVITLTGTGTGPAVTFSAQSLTFSGVSVGGTSAPKSLTLTNSGDQVLSVLGLSVSGSFAQTNNCPATLNAGANCTINITFSPASSGTSTGALTITDNAFGGSQSVSLTGSSSVTPSDFNLSGSVATATVKAGGTATYTIKVGSVGGTFSNAVQLSCSGAPQYSTCSLSQSSVIPGSGGATVTLTVKTTGKSTQTSQSTSDARPIFALLFQLQGFGIFGMVLAGSQRRSKKLWKWMVLALLMGSLMFLSACAGGTGIAQSGNSTPAGTYTITVSGTSGSLQHSLPVTLTVQ